MKNYYGVSQSVHGHEYRWIYDEDTLKDKMYDGKPVPADDCIDCRFPIGGSNSSATFIKRLANEDEIKAFLTAPAEGPDLQDPMLVDIGEYMMSIAENHDSCTDVFMKKFGLSYTALEKTDDCYGREQKVRDMFAKLQAVGYIGLDYANPFYGQDKDMRYSELCRIYEANT